MGRKARLGVTLARLRGLSSPSDAGAHFWLVRARIEGAALPVLRAIRVDAFDIRDAIA